MPKEIKNSNENKKRSRKKVYCLCCGKLLSKYEDWEDWDYCSYDII
jgi:hypothetical protein